jgi:tripartite ATP-independent transporter DctM subunit
MEWLILVLIILFTVINVPIAFGLTLTTALFLLWQTGTPLTVIPLNLFEGASKFPLLAIPLFILAGGLMETGGISIRLVNLASSLVGFIRGGLAMVTVLATMIQSEISGSSVADAAAIGKVVIPAMEQRGYPRAFSAAVVSNAASAAILIPPSIPMIIYAWMAEESVAKVFLAGFVPGFLAGGLMMGLCYYYARRYNYPVEERFSLIRVAETSVEAGWAMGIPAVIWGGIFLGVATATEVAALAAVAAFIIGVGLYRELNIWQSMTVVRESVIVTASVMVIVAASAVLGWYLTQAQIPQKFARAILETTNSAAAIILIVPVVMPLIRQIGVDPVHFGVIVTINLGVGQQTPPVASVLFVTSAIAGLPFWDVFRRGFPFTLVLVLVTLLVTYIPWLSLVLVDLVYG